MSGRTALFYATNGDGFMEYATTSSPVTEAATVALLMLCGGSVLFFARHRRA